MKRRTWDKESVLNEMSKCSKRSDFIKNSNGAYEWALKNGLSLDIIPSKRENLTEEIVRQHAKNFESKTEFKNAYPSSYRWARKNKIIDQLFENKIKKWTDDDLLLASKNFKNQTEFKRWNQSAFMTAWKRGLIKKMYPENKKEASARDSIYIWRAEGVGINNKDTYKIGVTSARVGKWRINKVSKASKINADIIILKYIGLLTNELEKKLLCMGVKADVSGVIDGKTEFRILNSIELQQALDLIHSYK